MNYFLFFLISLVLMVPFSALMGVVMGTAARMMKGKSLVFSRRAVLVFICLAMVGVAIRWFQQERKDKEVVKEG